MTLQQFMRDNRADIDTFINGRVNFVPRTASCYCPHSGTDHRHNDAKVTNEERRLWILNDEGLYRWARSEGVRI